MVSTGIVNRRRRIDGNGWKSQKHLRMAAALPKLLVSMVSVYSHHHGWVFDIKSWKAKTKVWKSKQELVKNLQGKVVITPDAQHCQKKNTYLNY
jgi:hypothetical protein